MADEPKTNEPGFFRKLAAKVWGKEAVDAFSEGNLTGSWLLAKERERKVNGRIIEAVVGTGAFKKLERMRDSLSSWEKRETEKEMPGVTDMMEHTPLKDVRFDELLAANKAFSKAVLSDLIGKIEDEAGIVGENPVQPTPGMGASGDKTR